MVFRSCWSAVRSRVHAFEPVAGSVCRLAGKRAFGLQSGLVDTQQSFSCSGLARQTGVLAGGVKSNWDLLVQNIVRNRRITVFLKEELVKQWSDASINSGRF